MAAIHPIIMTIKWIKPVKSIKDCMFQRYFTWCDKNVDMYHPVLPLLDCGESLRSYITVGRIFSKNQLEITNRRQIILD